MPINSPLSHITDVIQQVKASAQNYKTVLQNNEAATRATLIDPILRALGWDTADARMVVFELTSSSFRVDYALKDAQGHVKAIVEAKAFGGNLDDTSIISKLFSYAVHFGLREIWLTDGIIWHHHTNLNLNDLTPTKILDLVHNDPASSAAYFVASLDAAKYWPKEVTVDNVTQEVAKLRQQICEMQRDYDAIEARVKQLEVKHQPHPSATVSVVPLLPIPPSLPVASTTTRTFIDLPSFSYRSGLKPQCLRLPDSSELTVKSWSDVLRLCCEYVLSTVPNLPLPMSDHSARKVNLLSRTPIAENLSHSKFIYLDQPVYIYLNYDGQNCVRNANYILGKIQPTGVTPAIEYYQKP